MPYYRPVTITNRETIINRYKHLIENAGNLHAMTVSVEDHDWLLEQLGDDVSKVTGKQHTIRYANVFFQIGRHQRGIHIDSDEVDNIPVKWALNIPVVNCDLAIMKWYTGEYMASLYDNPVGLPSLHLDWQTEPTLVDSTSISSSLLVKVDTPHTVQNISANARCLLSIRFTPDLFDE